ncbi:DNA polymerase III subunit alpha [Jannaschia seohaensis]|uniref:DNA polymerase III subunit alpha n=1 Tax=Jannaschia seohaensis TaxID=475081 RepID=A0A2Y9A194_9RHOB|nr:DNA polymerase III subunit alpha [Jannaschia seohaensis]PWJ21942.1 DNA polymerase-3 subunit alpha [Jannaschia seohaensis]SSA38220.1 DNA polymerase-3 subunit alpha [Jannaschia seohaensis]
MSGMADPRFIHLRVHTEYSLLEGALRLGELPGLAAGLGMPAVAVTDTNNMFCALEAATKIAGKGVQPIMGCQVDLMFDPAPPGEKPRAPAPIVLLAQTEAGYECLMRLNSCLYLERPDMVPQVTVEELEAFSDGLICLTGGPDGPIGRLVAAGQEAKAEALLDRLHGIYGDRLYVELQRHRQPEPTERFHVEAAYAKGLPLVATNDVYFKDAGMHAAHDALLCIAEGAYVDQQAPRRRVTPEHRFKSPSEMAALFADLPEALENTVEIARRCAFKAYGRAPILPKFADDEVAELRRQSVEGLKARLAVIPHAAPVEEYEKRLDYELGIIEGMGFPGYFLIVADFIKWAKEQDIPVGPGRGSGAGSLVAYALTITDLDPLRYGLLFERFLNPERVSMPDFDIDFCMDRREEVIRYVQGKYGRDKVGQIITFGALLSKAAVRDVGRVLGMPYGQCDQLSKMIPVEGVKPVSITKALAEEPRLREAARESDQDRREGRTNPVARLLDFAEKLEGLLRNASTHAAGVVIGDRPLDRLVPLYKDPRSDMPATQFNMKWVEKAGLVKFDFLGLKTLTQVVDAVRLIREQGRDLHVAADGRVIYEPFEGTENDINAIPLDDPGAYRVYASAQTVAVFQVESTGMMDALRRMKPTCIEDIVALVALYRPGPMENIPKYCEVKNGLSARDKLHPLIDDILDETQGIIVYQEQVMEIARKLAGYSLGGADLLRRAMGKKIQAEMDAQKPIFLEGCAKNGVDKKKAEEVWALLDKFANYGFNKSHAAAYAVVSYQTAWLKANHPVEFMAGIMNSDIHLTDKLAVYAEEVRKSKERGGLGLEIVPPCINRSEAKFTVKDGQLIYALGALKNVGVDAMELIVTARRGTSRPGPRAGASSDGEVPGQARETAEKPFSTLYDFARRVDLKRVGKRPLEMLARAGAFDQIDSNRARVLDALDALVGYSAAIHEQRASNQVSLFGEAGEDLPEPRLATRDDWLPAERLAEEFKAIGFYLSGHPLDDYMPALKRQDVLTLAQVQELTRQGPRLVKMAGIVASRQERKSARGNRFAFLQASDPSGGYECMVFSDTLDASRQHLETGCRVLLQVEATQEADQLKLLARSVTPMDEAVEAAPQIGLRIFVEGGPDALAPLSGLLERVSSETKARGRGPVHLCLLGEDLPGEVEMLLPGEYPVNPQIKGALRSLPGVAMVEEV